MPKENLKAYLDDHLLIGDGAMATWLYQLGVPIGVCYEELNLSNPDLIRTVHRSYYEAGARFIQTNTYGANRETLSRHGLQDSVGRINRAAVQVARNAVGADAYVVGGIGSINGGRVRNTGEISTYGEQYEEQASALLEGGVDAILLETFLDVDELLLALDVIRPLTDLPIITQLATIEVGRTRDGHTLTRAFDALTKAGADVVGLNCRMGPAEILRSVENAVVPADTPLSVFPNAGRLAMSDGEYSYASVPQYFGESALRFRAQGARLIGGCCGTTPEHIRMMAQVLAEREPLPRVNPIRAVEEEEETAPIRVVSPPRPAGIVDTVKQRHTVIVELDPPRDLDTDKFLKGTEALRNAGADAITLADNSLATTRMSNMALGSLMKMKFGAEPLLHIACRDRNLIGQQSHLMGLHALGINQVLVITGDPARFGDLPGSSSVFDVSSFDLIRMIKQLNAGYSFSGKPLKQQANFVVGAAFNPHVRQFDAALRRLEKKVEAGADYIMTQPVYDIEMIERIHEGTKHLAIPIFIGVMPLTGSRNAEFLHNEVPGIRLSDEARARMRMFESGPEARTEGVAIARELVDAAMEYFNGIYLITPFFYYEMTAELTRHIHQNSSVMS
ncbi:bifunctional homocysteine S-methyltransferase/methylenetetrahydrofolate reductase [Aneurinibacillus sp. BA2021]|nr:bifunctional homocysteine S-methyltransferase/methylenetetrahydrofolate reductase [Aneurinibacillus sp. BA2021]